MYLAITLFVTAATGAEPEAPVTFGSAIFLQHVNTGFKLFSTRISWGQTNQQQIVTALAQKDYNEDCLWLIKPRHAATEETEGLNVLRPFDDPAGTEVPSYPSGTPVKCGDVVRLEHVETQKNLHAHREDSHISASNYEVWWR